MERDGEEVSGGEEGGRGEGGGLQCPGKVGPGLAAQGDQVEEEALAACVDLDRYPLLQPSSGNQLLTTFLSCGI